MTNGVNDISLVKGGRCVGLPTLVLQPPGTIQACTRLKKWEIKKNTVAPKEPKFNA